MSLPKPYYESEKAVIYCGDCLDILPHLSGVDAVVTDPPYGVGFHGKATKHKPSCGVGYTQDDCGDVGPLAVALCIGLYPRAVVFSGNINAHSYPPPRDIGGVFCPSGAGLGRWGFTCFHAALFYGSPRHGCTRPTAMQSNEVIRDKIEHPCPKPLGWMNWAVSLASEENETILDPFMGSGTTGVACMKLGRRFVGIEIEERYCEIAKRRIQESEGQFALFEPPKKIEQNLLDLGGA